LSEAYAFRSDGASDLPRSAAPGARASTR
jgi:hypothetical protein